MLQNRHSGNRAAVYDHNLAVQRIGDEAALVGAVVEVVERSVGRVALDLHARAQDDTREAKALERALGKDAHE